MTISVQVHLHTILQRESSSGTINRLDLNLAEGTTISQLLALLDIRLDPDALLLALNGLMADLDSTLASGDVVHLMPAISGG